MQALGQASMSRQKRLVDEEEDILADLTVHKKGKHGSGFVEELAAAKIQPRQAL